MENYEEAAESRLKDWESLSKGGSMTGTVHFGGIYIECLLKSMICNVHCVTEGDAPGHWNVDGENKNRPSHILTAQNYAELLEDLYDDMSADMMDSLKYISCPENISYINYRYIGENIINNEIYDKWMEHFIKVFSYLHRKKQEL